MASGSVEYADLIRSACSTYRKVLGPLVDAEEPRRLRVRLGDALIAANVEELPEEGDEAAYDAIESLLRHEAAEKPLTNWQDLPVTAGDSRLAVWQGDITTLQIDAIVNAANDRGLGCFVAAHRCIDNVIHRAAGPRLRMACARELRRQADRWRGRLPTGEAMITEAFCLPSKFVIHTPGPQGEYPDLLAACYRNVLDRCRENGVRSVALCCISTGLYGYPNDRAAEVAVATVRQWLGDAEAKQRAEAAAAARAAASEHDPPPPSLPLIDRVVFNVFLDKDWEIYQRLLNAPTR